MYHVVFNKTSRQSATGVMGNWWDHVVFNNTSRRSVIGVWRAGTTKEKDDHGQTILHYEGRTTMRMDDGLRRPTRRKNGARKGEVGEEVVRVRWSVEGGFVGLFFFNDTATTENYTE